MRIGVVGAGVIGRLRARSVLDRPETELAGVMDVSLDAATAAAAGAPVFDELAPFLDVPMDAVIFSTPTHLHEEACLAAIARGLHVLCEKPLAHTLEGSRRIVAAAAAAGRVLTVGFNLRYYPAMAWVKEVIDEGRIGELDHLRVFGGHEGIAKFRVDWQYRAPESGGGALWDVGIHMTDLARWYLGEITEVYGVATERVWGIDGSEDNAIAVLKSPAGVAASYQATWGEWRGYRIFVEAFGTEGMVRGSYAPMRNVLVTGNRPGVRKRVTHKRWLDVQVREKLKTWHDTALRSFTAELADFVDLARGGSGGRIADARAGLRAVEIADAVRRSTRTGEAVRLPDSRSDP